MLSYFAGLLEAHFPELCLKVFKYWHKWYNEPDEKIPDGCVFGVDTVEKEFINSNKYKLDLSFFDYGEVKIDADILDKIKNHEDIINLKFASRKEGLYYLLRLLKDNNMQNVIIAYTKEQWNTLDKTIKDHMLIPFFVSDEPINAIDGNTTFFIYSNGNYVEGARDIIEIKPRRRDNLFGALHKGINNLTEVDRIIKKTNGIFPAIVREINKGQVPVPIWSRQKGIDLLPAFLLGAWTERDGDKEIVERLSGYEYEKYISEIKVVMGTDDPFAVCFHNFGDKVYRISEPVVAWEVLSNSLVLPMEKFQKVIYQVFWYDNDAIDKVEEPLKYDNGKYSTTLKCGIITTLTIMNLLGDQEQKSFVNSMVYKLLEKINTKEQWLYIAGFMSELIEVAPEAVLNKIESEISGNSEFWQIFQIQNNAVFGKHYYPNVLFALEKAMLMNNDLLNRSIEILATITEKEFTYTLGNTPVATLEKVFCVWENEVALTKEDKIDTMRRLATKHPKVAWEVLSHVLPLFNISYTYTPLCSPAYIIGNGDSTTVKQLDVITIYKAYFELAFALSGKDLSKWSIFFEGCTFIPYGFKETVFDNVSALVQDISVSDEAKYEFSKVVRKFIWHQRYFEKNDLSSEDVQMLEDGIFNKISYKNKLYKYLYAFTEHWNFHELHPIPSSQDSVSDYSDDKNIQRQRKVFDSILQEEDVDILSLIEYAEDDYITGVNLAECVSKNQINTEIVSKLFDFNKYRTLTDGYLRHIANVKGDKVIIEFYQSTGLKQADLYLKFLVLSVLVIKKNNIDFISALSVEEQKYYWERVYGYAEFVDLDFATQCMSKVIANHNYALAVMWGIHNNFAVQTYIDLLSAVANNFAIAQSKLHTIYDLQLIFEKIYKQEVPKAEASIIWQLELIFCDIFDDKIQPKFLLKCLKQDANFTAELVSKICRNDDGEIDDVSIEKGNEIYCIQHALYKIKFCPCEVEGNIDNVALFDWCKNFSDFLVEHKQSIAKDIYLGKFLANSPKDPSGDWPHEAVCKVIEKYHSRNFDNEFRCEVHNNRGVYSSSGGVEEVNLSEQYEDYAKGWRNYPNTVRILKMIASDYKNEGALERERSVYE